MLFAVIAAHVVVTYFVIRATPMLKFNAPKISQQFVLVYLPAPAQDRPFPDVSKRAPSRHRKKRNGVDSATRTNDPAPISVPQAEQPPPTIDWEKEAEVAAQNSIKPDGYRNLSGLSPEQLKWISDNRFEPQSPGIVWKRPVFDHTSNGMPIIHLGDRCVIMPPLPMVFCKIGRKN